MEESGSIGLQGFIERKRAEGWFEGVDAVCISDNYWLGPRKPCITYGLRGLAYFALEVSCAAKDLHSGVYGGPVREAMVDLAAVLASLHNADGSIAVPGIMDGVRPMSDAERASLEAVDFTPAEFAAECGASALRFAAKADVLAARWRYPSLSIHGIEGAFFRRGRHGPSSPSPSRPRPQ